MSDCGEAGSSGHSYTYLFMLVLLIGSKIYSDAKSMRTNPHVSVMSIFRVLDDMKIHV